jgi:hypothetical protein
MNKEGDIYDLANSIFSEQPGQPNSTVIAFNNITLKETFEDILTFLVEGLKIKFANEEKKINLYDLDETQLLFINKYMNSIGLTLNLNVYNIFEWLFDKSKHYTPYNEIELTPATKLSELKQMFLVNDKAFLISFGFN